MTRLLPWAVVAAVLAGVTANVLRLRGEVSLAGPSVAAQALDVAAGSALIIAGAAGGRGRWLLAAAGTAWLAAEWANPAAPGAVLFTVGLVAFLAPLPLVLASRSRHPSVDSGPAVLLATAVLLSAAAAVLTGPLVSAAASPRDAGCTDLRHSALAR